MKRNYSNNYVCLDCFIANKGPINSYGVELTKKCPRCGKYMICAGYIARAPKHNKKKKWKAFIKKFYLDRF